MRPLRLSLSAFGPFAEKQEIDFTELGDCSFLLIHGPTGSGKTAILDALCFALYGDTSGEDRSAEQLRSQHASPDLLTEVTFDFALGSDQYRITRSPKQERPKVRGEGTRTEQAAATLWKRNGMSHDTLEGEAIATQPTKVTLAIETLFGFRSNEFRQVVMLPQGKFQKLLMANSSDREEILQNIFQTSIYQRIEETLQLRAKELADAIRDNRKECDRILQDAMVPSLDELREQKRTNENALDELRGRLAELRRTEDAAQGEFTKAMQVDEKLKEKRVASLELEGMEAQRPLIEDKELELANAQKAVPIIEIETALQKRLGEEKQAESKLEDGKAKLADAEEAERTAQVELEKEEYRAPARQAAQRKRDELRDLRDVVTSLQQAQADLSDENQRVAEATQKCNQTNSAVKSAQTRQKKTERMVRQNEQDANQLKALKLQEDELKRQRDQRAKLDDAAVKLDDALSEQRKANARFQKIQGKVERSRIILAQREAAWHKNQAADLAHQLVDGKPCPVCGSNEHPNPTRFTGKQVSKEKLEEQQKDVDTLQAELESVRQEVATQDRVVTKWQTAKEQIESQLGQRRVSLTSLDQRLRRIKKSREKAQAVNQELTELRNDLQKIEYEIRRAQTQLSTWDSKRAKARERQARAKAVVKERKLQMPKGLQTIDQVEAAIKEAERRFKTLEKAYTDAQKGHTAASNHYAACLASLKGFQDVATRARNVAVDQQHAFETRIHEAGFANERAYELARRSQPEIATLDSEIREYAGQLEACQARATRANQAALGLVQPDSDRLGLELQHTKDAVLGATRDERTLEIRVNQFAKWKEELSDLVKASETQEKRFEVIGRLAEIANGTNSYRMTFQRFVLASLLDDVLQTTSHRLQMMSRNRYLLQRAQTIGDKRKAGGLDLEVLDAFTGKPRLAATLSGGEQFLASLSLALGLADVVQSWAGGVSLETLFIDEGFGSLDDELRDLALRALIDLQQGGRLVGIISHIREIREFAKARLEVIPTNRGSSIKLIVN